MTSDTETADDTVSANDAATMNDTATTDDTATTENTEGVEDAVEFVVEGHPAAARSIFSGNLERGLEAIFMVADEPQTLVSLATALGAPIPAIRQSIERLVEDYDGASGGPMRGFELREVGGGWRIYVRSEFDDVVRDFVLTQNPTRLSQAALETLAVIAYKQPISRGSIASIRAVNVDSVVRTLLGRGLITEAYTDSETGAIHYATTDLLLTQLGINSIDELPHISPLLEDGSAGFDDLR